MNGIIAYTLLMALSSVVAQNDTKEVIQVVWMVPFSSHKDNIFPYNASSSVAAMAYGIETVKNESLLPNYVLNLTMVNSECNSKQSIGALVDLLCDQPIDVLLGPPCPEVVQPVGELMAYYNIPVINWVSLQQTIEKKDVLSTYVRTMTPLSSLKGLVNTFITSTGWKRFVIIRQSEDEYKAGADIVENGINSYRNAGWSVARTYSLEDHDDGEMLKSIMHEGRIVFLFVHASTLRRLMITAHNMNMTNGEYQFLYTYTKVATGSMYKSFFSDRWWRKNDTYDDIARQAFENVLIITLGQHVKPAADWQDYALNSYNNLYRLRSDIPEPTTIPDEYSGYLFDSIRLYATLLNVSLRENKTKTGRDLAWVVTNNATQIQFKGLTGDVIMSTSSFDRMPAFFVLDMDKTGTFDNVAYIIFRFKEDGSLDTKSDFKTIRWGNGRNSSNRYFPPDTPKCGFFGDLCPSSPPPPTLPEQNSNEVTIIITACIALVTVLIMFIVYRWWRKEQDLKNTAWKINPSDLFFVPKHDSIKLLPTKSLTRRIHRLRSTSSIESAVSTHSRILSHMRTLPIGSDEHGHVLTNVAEYKGQTVAVKKSRKKKINIDRNFMLLMKNLSSLKHSNVTAFIGVCTEPEKVCSVWEFCSKGSVQDVIKNEDINLDTMFKLSITVDICQGLDYIHKSPMKYHGNLKSSNCVIDSRWVCKLTDFNLQKLRHIEESVEYLGEDVYYSRLFWTPPEYLRKILRKEVVNGSVHGDVYALGIIMKELVCRNEPYSTETANYTPKEIITKVAKPVSTALVFRPEIFDNGVDSEYLVPNMKPVIRRCWEENEDARPPLKTLIRTLNRINPYKKASMVDNMMAMMEKYTTNLEDIVTERTEQLQEEKQKTDALLYRMLPPKVAEDLKFGRSFLAEGFDSVTIYLSDIVQFTNLANESTPMEIVNLLNALYTLFDESISPFDVYKVETIGDAYMVVSGLPERNGNVHVREIAGVALNILNNVLHFIIPHKPERQLKIRIGLHTGPVVAGVIGLVMPRYCLFGDTVNTASRMESNGEPLRIHISEQTKLALEEFPQFDTDKRGEMMIKGKGLMTTYWLTGQKEIHTDFEETHADMASDSSRESKLSLADSGIDTGRLSMLLDDTIHVHSTCNGNVTQTDDLQDDIHVQHGYENITNNQREDKGKNPPQESNHSFHSMNYFKDDISILFPVHEDNESSSTDDEVEPPAPEKKRKSSSFLSFIHHT
ncbi:atrial natriuretic peptide receptor 1-like isoform X2 [Mya arenaria]|uniref:atrial natriuretic peptide receptor 1-like isoform X2 n=1 Tax=Mya arenaria TaxID=6604 RepID=UPI0022E452FE|nr:atrial natriuretic peptide receptor 1-like isoform X2 [Mya arenaria]